ncbi:MAG TPA: hypothetical protein VHB21_06005 [Minicystis sp.]|nr:hypothetical protein [Minicystis sp.]
MVRLGRGIVLVGLGLLATSAFGCVAETGDSTEDVGQGDQAVAPETKPNGKGFVTREAHGSGGGGHTTSNGINYHGGPLILGSVNVYYIW